MGGFVPTFLLLTISVTMAAGLDLTPRFETVPAGEGHAEVMYFKTEAGKLYYQPPSSWTSSGSKARFVSRAPSPSVAELVIEAKRLDSSQPLPGKQGSLVWYGDRFRAAMLRIAPGAQVGLPEVVGFGGSDLPCTKIQSEYRPQNQIMQRIFSYVLFRPDTIIEVSVVFPKESSQMGADAMRSLEGFTEMRNPEEKPESAKVYRAVGAPELKETPSEEKEASDPIRKESIENGKLSSPTVKPEGSAGKREP